MKFVLLLNCVFIKYSICFQIETLSGKWILNGKNVSNVEATVPGGVYSDLMDNGIIGNIYNGYNDVNYRWIANTDWTFFRNFTIDPHFLSYTQINVVFDGLDTFATIFVNGQKLASTQNMFVRYIFNIAHYLKSGINEISVQFTSPIKKAEILANNQPYNIPPNCPPMQYRGECHVNQIRKMQASFAWDWGPAFPSMGIWKAVYLEGFNTSVIRDIVVNLYESGDDWILGIVVFLDGTCLGIVTHKIQLIGFSVEEIIRVQHCRSEFNMTIPKITVKNWWPNGYGEQNLYNLITEFKNNQETNRKATKIGFRKIELVQTEIGQGLNFYFRINDIPIFIKGSNEIPLDILPEKGQNPEIIKRILYSVKETNMNMLRVWGGGVYESNYFYELADELGILIWQDFMFACALYPSNPEFLENVRAEVQHQVKRLNSHPSIALWAGNNENEVALMTNWYNTSPNITKYKNDYISLYINTIKREFQTISNKIFLSSSPSNGKESEKEGNLSLKPQSPQFGDVHFYNYLLNSLEISTYPVPRFASEYGYQSLPDFNVWLQTTNNLQDLELNSTFLDHRQHHPAGSLQNFLLINYQLQLPDQQHKNFFKAFIYYSQIIQALSIKFESELYRSWMARLNQKGEGNTMGALFWQLNDVWIAPTWSGIGKWKMLQYYVRDFFAPIIVTGHLSNVGQLEIFVISDVPFMNKLEGTVYLEVFRWDSFQVVNQSIFPVFLDFGKSLLIDHTIKSDEFLSNLGCGLLNTARSNCFFRLVLKIQNLLIAPENFVFPTKLKNSNLPTAKLEVLSVKKIDDLSRKFQITLKTDAIALFVWLDTYKISGTFSENGFIQTTPIKTVYFSAENAVKINEFQGNLTVTHLRDSQYL